MSPTCVSTDQTSGSTLIISILLLDVDDNDAQRSNQSQGLDAQEPEQHPKEDNHYWFYYLVPKVHLAEAHFPQTLVEHPKQSPHPLTVIQLGLSSSGVIDVGPSGMSGRSKLGLADINPVSLLLWRCLSRPVDRLDCVPAPLGF